jgi:hypothetical protein
VVLRFTMVRFTVLRDALAVARATGTCATAARATAGRVLAPACGGTGSGDGGGRGTATWLRVGDPTGGADRGGAATGAATGAASSMSWKAEPQASIAQRAISVATKRSADHCIANDDASVSHSARSTDDPGSR